MENGNGNAQPVASSSRSPNKVAFKEQREEFEYRSRYSDSASSESEQTTCSTSDSSSGSSSERCRRSHSRRRKGRDDCCHRRRKHASDRHRSGRDSQPRRHRHAQQQQGTSTSSASAYDATAGVAPGNVTSSGPPGPPPPGPHPQVTLHGQQGMVCTGAFPYPPDQRVPLALLPPPGSGPYPSSPSPASSTPTKAYTSPRSAQDPPPMLLLSSYGAQHHGCPAANAYAGPAGAAIPPTQAQPASLLEPMQMLALNGGGGVAAAPPPPQSYPLPPPPGALPLSLPEPPPQALQQLPGGLNMLYDETMQEVVLADAVMVNALGRQGHALVPLNDAYRSKLAALQAAVNGQLLAKREALLQQHARLAARAGEVAAQRAALEREVAILTEDMIGRIRGAESLKQGALGREQADVGAQLDAIQRLLGDIMAASAAGPVDFLNAYSRLTDTCARLVAKPFKQAVDVTADDLPQEAGVYKELVAAHEALRQLLGVKDAMITHLLQERDSLQDELRQVVERFNAELSALEAQCQGYYRRLLALGAGSGGEEAVAVGDSPGARTHRGHRESPSGASGQSQWGDGGGERRERLPVGGNGGGGGYR